MIPQRNISIISNTLVTAGGRRIPEAVIERDYVLAWFLSGLAGHPLRAIVIPANERWLHEPAMQQRRARAEKWLQDHPFKETDLEHLEVNLSATA